MHIFRLKTGKLAGIVVVALFIVSAFFGGINLISSTASAASAMPSQQGGNVTVGTGYSLTSWNLSGGTQILQGNLTIRAGGVVTLSNETLMFDEFSASGNYASAPVYHISVVDGGKLIMKHSVVTTNLQLINDIPVLGVFESNGASIVMSAHSSFVFPGQFVSYMSNLTMINSTVTGFQASQFSANYINSSVFPASVFANPPVVSFYSSNVVLQNSRMYMYSLNGAYNSTTVYKEHYPFASDTARKNNVTYSLEAIPTSVFRQSPLADTTTNQNIFNLTAFDQSNYTVQAGQTMSATNFTTGGINAPLSSVTLNAEYETTGSSFAGTMDWAYGNTTQHVQQVSLTNTESFYYPGKNNYYTTTVPLPAGLTENDLSRLQVWANVTSGTMYVNKLWFGMTFSQPAYKNLTIAGSSSFTAIHSFIDANFLANGATHDAVFVGDTAHAYFYDVTINQQATIGYNGPYAPAFAGHLTSMDAKPLTFGPLNAAVAPTELSFLDSNTADYYNISAGAIMQTYGLNVSQDVTLNTQLKSATLSLTAYSLTATTTPILIGQVGQPVSSYIQSGISIPAAPVGPATYTANLYALGFTSLSQLKNLVIYANNIALSGNVRIKNVNIQTGILPQMFLYRFANVTVSSSQNLPVINSQLSFKYSGSTPTNISVGSPAGYFVGPSNTYQTVPPAQVLSYLGRTVSNYNVTNEFGKANVPLLTDVIGYSTYPNSLFVGNYTLTVSYNSSLYGNSLSFSPYPNITAASQEVSVNITIPVTVPLPLINVGRPVVTPSFLYQNQTGVITFNITDSGQTGVNSLPVNISDGANGKLISSLNMSVSIGPLQTLTVSVNWFFAASGNNTIAVNANQNRSVPETSYAGDYNSTLFFVQPNLAELVIASSGITFNPSPAFSGKNVVITADVQNFLGRAGVKNLTVGFYYGNPLNGGTLIGTSIMNVLAGGANTTSINWIPTIIGSAPIYVYLDPAHTVPQYSTAGNLNYSVLTIYLSVGPQDLVVNNSNSAPTVPFEIVSAINISSNIVVTQSGYLLISNGGVNFIEAYNGQYSFLINQTGKTVIENSIISSNYLVNMYVFGGAQLFLINTVIGPNVNLITGGNSRIWINGSTIMGNVLTAAFSSASIRSFNSSFSNSLSFGYNEVAKLYNASAPSVTASSSGVAYIYRWLYVTTYGQSGTTLSGAVVTLNTFANLTNPHGAFYAQRSSNGTGVATFEGLSDIIKSGSDVYVGNYVVNTTYVDAGTWYAPNETVSLSHYTVPLIQKNSAINAVLFIKLPDLTISSSNIFFTPTQVVEGSSTNITVLIYNIGYAPVTQNFTVYFSITQGAFSQLLVATTTLTHPFSVSQSVPLPVTAIWAVPMLMGNMSVSVDVNPANLTGQHSVAEISYTNNIANAIVDVFSLPLLSPVSLNATGSFQEETNMTFNVVVQNTGQISAYNVPLTLFDGPSAGNVTTPIANATIPVVAGLSSTKVSLTWTVPLLPTGVKQKMLLFSATVNQNRTIRESSYSQDTLAQPVAYNITLAKVNAVVIISSNSIKSGSVVIVTVSMTSQVTHKPMANYPVTVELFNIRGQEQVPSTVTGLTNSQGIFVARILVPPNQPQGAYHFEVYSNGQFVSSSRSFNIISSQPTTGIPLLYWLLIGIIIIAGFVGVSLYLYRYGLARVVECGNCGAFIPETSKKCTYCGVEFETGTAKCSNCNSWIPSSSKECPVCGVKFADEGEGDKEDDANAEMRRQYMEFTDKFKAQARAEMGNKYSDRAFLNWWKKQPTYLSFEDWLARQQELKKAKMVQCPSCGEMNPANLTDCMKCGTPLREEKSNERKDEPPKQQPPPQIPQGKPVTQEPRRIVVPKRVIRKVEEKPQETGGQAEQGGAQNSTADKTGDQKNQ